MEMADSTTSKVIHRSDSAETIGYGHLQCRVCSVEPANITDLQNFVDNSGKTFCIIESTCYLVCGNCRECVEHVHCHLGRSDLDLSDLILAEDLDYRCPSCAD